MRSTDLGRKLKIIVMLKSRKSLKGVSTITKVPKSTIAYTWKQREKIECHVSLSDYPATAKIRCIVREAGSKQTCGLCNSILKVHQYLDPLLQEKA